jgi:hypothetical protein
VIPTDTIYDKVFNFTDTEPFNSNFNNMGFGTMNIVKNLGSNFFYIAIILVAYLVHFIIKYLKNKLKM